MDSAEQRAYFDQRVKEVVIPLLSEAAAILALDDTEQVRDVLGDLGHRLYYSGVRDGAAEIITEVAKQATIGELTMNITVPDGPLGFD